MDTTLCQPPGGQSQHDLDRHVFPPAKSPADGGINNPDFFFRQTQGMGNLLTILMRPLSGDLDCNASFLIDIAQPGFRL